MNEILTLTTKEDRELALARLIDDELTAAQERELLKHLDAHPELWRDCALGFLEERALRRGARGWVKAQESAPVPSQPAPAVLGLTAEKVVPRIASKQRSWLDYTTIAAGLLLAFIGGSVLQQYQSRPLPTNTPVAKDSAPPTAPNQQADDASSALLAKTDSPSNLRLQYVSNEGQPSNKEIDVPLIPVNKVDDSMLSSWEQAARQNTIPQETLRWLEQEGQVVRQQNLWLTVDLPNGQQALVPVQRIVVQPRHLLAQ